MTKSLRLRLRYVNWLGVSTGWVRARSLASSFSMFPRWPGTNEFKSLTASKGVKLIAKTVIACALACSSSGCYTLQYSGTELPDDSVSFSRNSQAKVERYLAVEERAVYIFHGLIPVSMPNIAQTLRREIGNKPVQALRIKSQQTVTDILLAGGLALLGAVVVSSASRSNPQTAPGLAVILSFVAPQFLTVSIDGEVTSDEAPKPSSRK